MRDKKLQQTVLKIKNLNLNDLVEHIKTSELSAD